MILSFYILLLLLASARQREALALMPSEDAEVTSLCGVSLFCF